MFVSSFVSGEAGSVYVNISEIRLFFIQEEKFSGKIIYTCRALLYNEYHGGYDVEINMQEEIGRENTTTSWTEAEENLSKFIKKVNSMNHKNSRKPYQSQIE